MNPTKPGRRMALGLAPYLPADPRQMPWPSFGVVATGLPYTRRTGRVEWDCSSSSSLKKRERFVDTIGPNISVIITRPKVS